MARITYKLNGFRDLRKSPGVLAAVKKLTEDIAEDCNRDAGLQDGYIAKVSQGRIRPRGVVITGTAKAIRDNARNNTIIRNASRSR